MLVFSCEEKLFLAVVQVLVVRREVIGIGFPNEAFLVHRVALELLQLGSHALNLLLKLVALSRHLRATEKQVEIAVLGVARIELTLDRYAVNATLGDSVVPIGLEGPTVLLDHGADKGFASFDHHQEMEALFFDELDVGATEATAVEDETDVPIAKSVNLFNQVGKLTDIID